MENIKDFKIFGFYDPVGLEADESRFLQTIYLIDGRYYVMYRKEDFFTRLTSKLDGLISRYKSDREKLYYEVSEFMSHFHEAIDKKDEYYLHEIDITFVHDLIVFNDSVLVSDNLELNTHGYNDAVVLDKGLIAVGEKEYLSQVINERVQSKRDKYELLEDLYYNHYDYEKREEIINEFYHEFLDDLDNIEREIWEEKKINNYLMLYALSLLDSLNVDFREIKEDDSLQERVVR